jgi:two-component system, NarL family, sensor kinase
MFAKLFLSHTLVALVAIVALAGIFYSIVSDNLIQRTINQLSSINILKGKLVENYFLRSKQNLEALQLEHKFLDIYREVFSSVENGMSIHTADMEEVENICRLYNFKNIHMFDLHHRQIYSTDSMHYQEHVLKKIDSIIREEPKRLRLIDASHTSRDNHTLIFYYVPIIQNSERVGVVLVEEKFQNIQSIVSEITGMGTTGESYIVGPEYTMRSSSRFFRDEAPGSISVKTEAVRSALAGTAGSGVITDYRNKKVLSVYRPVDDADVNWAIVSEIDWTEAMAPIVRLRYYLVGITFFMLVLTTIITFFLSNAIAQPILKLRKIVYQLSRGIVPTQRILVKSQDEVGQMADAIYQLTDGFQRTSEFAEEIGKGNFNAPFVTLSEYDSLGHSLIQMRDELKAFHAREAKQARARASALLEGQENERRRIIAELHDGVGQLLTAIRIRVEMLEGDDPVKEEIKKQINDTIAEVRRVSYNVMPQALVDFGLEAALKGLCDSIKRYANLDIDFTYVRESGEELNFEITTALFRIAQEGLNNVIKYASATVVKLHVIQKEDEVYFALEDNGKGFDIENMKAASGMGLQNIRERAKLLNGSTEIHSASGQGTVIEVHIPIEG